MYSIQVDLPKDAIHADYNEYIVQELMKMPKGPVRSYLLQCADWQRDDYNPQQWRPYSPIYNKYTGDLWPIYDLDGLEYADETSIEFNSWKGDYEPETYTYAPQGSLPNPKKDKCFKGTIWTRG